MLLTILIIVVGVLASFMLGCVFGARLHQITQADEVKLDGDE